MASELGLKQILHRWKDPTDLSTPHLGSWLLSAATLRRMALEWPAGEPAVMPKRLFPDTKESFRCIELGPVLHFNHSKFWRVPKFRSHARSAEKRIMGFSSLPKQLSFDLRSRPTHYGPWEVGPSSPGALTFRFSDSSRLL